MAPSSVKLMLKEARSALDDKDFDNAKKICRDILKQDKNNYHAYIFIGVAAAGTNESDRAFQAYQKAIELRPEQPLAYKGLIEILPNTQLPDKQLQLARAHVSLATYAQQFAKKSLPEGANILYKLALKDKQFIAEALNVLNTLNHEIPPETDHDKCAFLSKMARLYASKPLATILEQTEDQHNMKKLPSLQDILSQIQSLMQNFEVPIDTDIRQMVVDRVLSAVMANDNFEENIAFLKHIRADEALLEFAETDKGAFISSDERANYAYRSIHMYPYESNRGRANQVITAELLHLTNDTELAINTTGISISGLIAKGEINPDYSPPSCTHALVTSLLCLLKSQHKLSVQIAKAGQDLALKQPQRERITAFLQLICASGLSGERKHKESTRELEKVRKYGQQEGNQWIERAANHGIINTAVAGHGRRSRQASTAMEEAAGSNENIFGVMECVWTEAISEDNDTARMESVCENALQKAKTDSLNKSVLDWECRLLNPTFIVSDVEVAATAYTRLGQMILAEDDSYPDMALKQAQKYQMEAANIYRGMANPFAQLGFIFEQQATSDPRMSGRALRCYEKAINLDETHPLASRRLVRMLVDEGATEQAAEIAQKISEINPKARWAHNVVGWWRIENQALNEATVSFRNALRGRPRSSAKDEETLFGTTVGQTAEDNDLLVDVDSWRGLSVTYQKQGKFSPAAKCIEDGIALLQKPPTVYITTIKSDVIEQVARLETILQGELAILMFLARKPRLGYDLLRSLLTKDSAPATVKYHLCKVYQQFATEEWFKGCYRQATCLRQKAVNLISEFAELEIHSEQKELKKHFLQTIADVCLEIVTDFPGHLARIVSTEVIEEAFMKAKRAYSRVFDINSTEESNLQAGLAEIQLRHACFLNDKEQSKEALNKLLEYEVDPCRLVIAFVMVSQVINDKSMCRVATKVAQTVASTDHVKGAKVEVSATIALQSDFIDDIDTFAKAALKVIQEDPVDWRGWYAIGIVREADAKRKSWPINLLVSSEEAFLQADRFGGGPAAVQGRVRCLTKLLEQKQISGQSDQELYHEASFCSALTSRAGSELSPICSKIIENGYLHSLQIVVSRADDIASQGQLAILNHVHMFPFVPQLTNMVKTL